MSGKSRLDALHRVAPFQSVPLMVEPSSGGGDMFAEERLLD